MNEKRIPALLWNKGVLELIDQRYLPHREKIIKVTNIEECFDAIKNMVVRGAPLIGFTAIWGMVLWSRDNPNSTLEDFEKMASFLGGARPTAVNLEFELKRCSKLCADFIKQKNSFQGFDQLLISHAHEEFERMKISNEKMGKIGEETLDRILTKKKFNIMTLCNTGYLACGPMGTALGVVEHLNEVNKIGRVYACETRPYLQGARLTSYELKNLNIPHDIVVEGAMSYILGNGLVDAVFVGADRIAANGDTANKIGTSTLSLVCAYYQIPFFIVAPTSTFDLNIKDGTAIPIELRDENEIHYIGETRITPENTSCLNPSFDVTESQNITGIICENGLISPVNKDNVLSTLKARL